MELGPIRFGRSGLSVTETGLVAAAFKSGLPATGFAATTGYIASKGVPLPQLAAAIAIAVELGLGLLLLVGLQARWAALGMAFFTLVITFIFHNFWGADAAAVMQQQQAFFKNIAVVGGLLTVAAWGPGAWSIDGKRGA